MRGNLPSRYGAMDVDDWRKADLHIAARFPLLVEDKGIVRFCSILCMDMPEKEPEEMIHDCLRSHAAIKYSQDAILIFNMEGVILQQNPASMRWFGSSATENTIFTNGTNRLAKMFGGDLTTYTKIMDALNKADRMEQSWSGRARLLLKDMKANPLRTDETSTRDLLPTLEELDAQAEEVEEQAVWVRIYAHKFRDPADGKEAIYMELADITRLVNKEEAVKESRQHEHAILKEIIPEHIIGFLLEEKKSKERRGSGADSGISSPGPGRSQSDVALLSLDNIRAACESRVASMAELHHNVTVLFTDIVGFTKISSQFEPAAVMVMLNNLFTMFDEASDFNSIYKVETIGDSYMCASGLDLKSEREKHADKPARFQSAKGCPKYHASRMLSFAIMIIKVSPHSFAAALPLFFFHFADHACRKSRSSRRPQGRRCRSGWACTPAIA